MNFFKVIFIGCCLLLASCSYGSSAEDESIKTEESLSPVILKSEDLKMVGIKNKLGILGPEPVAKKKDKFAWHFWGDKEKLRSKHLKVIAVNNQTNKTEKVLTTRGTSNTFWEIGSPGGPNHGADAHLPSTMIFPSSGVWTLNVYLGDERFGTITLKVN